MALPKPPPLGYPIPDKHHAVSVHFPTWEDVCDFGLGRSRVLDALKNGYPRTFLHKDVQGVRAAAILNLSSCVVLTWFNGQLFDMCSRDFLPSSEELVLFPDYRTAADCKSFITSQRIHDAEAAHPEDISLFAVDFDERHETPDTKEQPLPISRLYAVVHPVKAHSLKMMFWRLTGTGISSRLAKQCLNKNYRFTKITTPPPESPPAPKLPVYETIRGRVAELLERSPINPLRPVRVRSDDVYLYPSGMSAIYHVHHLLLNWRNSDIIMLGFPYELSIKMIETLGPPYRFFSFGTDSEIDELEEHVIAKGNIGIKIQAVWCECPNNPMLRTADLNRVRRLADKYDFLLVVDDTIGSFANVDVQDVADIVVTSLSKYFSGFADVLAGSAVLNPNSQNYQELKLAFNASYANNLYAGDAMQLELNSRDYLKRFAQQNDTASYLVDFLHPYTSDSNSALTTVYYPKVCWSKDNYRARMRPATEDFVPGFGGVFSVAFETVTAASAFFDNLDVYKGPSFGANITIALPYVQLVLQKQKAWASSHGLKETLVRISVGLDDKEALLECVKVALQAADATK